MEQVPYTVYMLLCEDGSLYTGIAKDVEARFKQHVHGLGARYTRSHKPVKIVFKEICTNRSSAQKREACIKRLSRLQKEALLGGCS